MLTLFGDSPHSDFRLGQLFARLQAAQPEAGLISLRSEVIYFIDNRGILASEQEQFLKDLLSAYSPHTPLLRSPALRAASPSGRGEGARAYEALTSILIVPRLGTCSSWSSKASCIAEVCGLGGIVKRIERGVIYYLELDKPEKLPELAVYLHDRMTESVLFDPKDASVLFDQASPKSFKEIPILEKGLTALEQINIDLGLALSNDEIKYLLESFKNLGRNPSDLELMMFAQANSEHCRHKIFNAIWMREGKPEQYSLFDMIRYTYKSNPQGVISAYKDNGAVLQGSETRRWLLDPHTQVYGEVVEPCHIVIKVETHNHPTAIAPTEGAATGSGGEIRDEGAVGRGSKPKAGLVGFTVSNLRIPDFIQPWEPKSSKPGHMASALEIMLEGPVGAASFNNEFGRPGLCGYFRSYEQGKYGYHKPIMIAGGLGNVRPGNVSKGNIPDGAKMIVLGGPAMLIGLGGSAASSMASGSSDQALDFASVQRSNPQLQRCCQEVIDACCALGKENPIIAIHDVGAGGLANALPELVYESNKGAFFDLRAINNAEIGMSPLEIWCNEAQERYVLAVLPSKLEQFENIAKRERCPYAIVGEVNNSQNLVLGDPYFNNKPADLPFSVLFGKTPKLIKNRVDYAQFKNTPENSIDLSVMNLPEAARRVLQLPCVADKSFLITIGDRSIGGLVARDQMVGPWQVPVSDVAVTLNSFSEYGGEAMAMGERSPVALIDPVASVYLAVGEAITNISAAYIGEDISNIKLSANWMAADDKGLYEAVEAVAMDLCPALGICIPVGKDSLSMRTVWTEDNQDYSVSSPVSLVISAFSPVLDVRKTLTPVLNTQNKEETELLLISINNTNNTTEPEKILAGSALAQVYGQIGNQSGLLFNPKDLKAFFQVIQILHKQDLLLAYHDRSDGGLFVTLCEMAFASHTGLDIALDALFGEPPFRPPISIKGPPSPARGEGILAALFNEWLGAVVQIYSRDKCVIEEIFKNYGLLANIYNLGKLNTSDKIRFISNGQDILIEDRITWQRFWSETSYRMQSLRDSPECALQAYDKILDQKDPGLYVCLNSSFELDNKIHRAAYIHKEIKPKVAILREQGVNGHMEMAAAFSRAGFTSVDVHMSDIISGQQSLSSFTGLAVCGGFSYGDVLGSGQGWAKSILFNTHASQEFTNFFARSSTFTLGVCNGCQMLSHLTDLIPGSNHWPKFKRNKSEQFEARLVMVKIEESPSLFFKDMQGSELPIVISHGEGRAVFSDFQNNDPDYNNLVTLRFINNQGEPTESYPENPNGSPEGITGLTSQDGRVSILMPHPERIFRSVQSSWHPSDWPEDSPWMKLFYNARKWVG